MRHTLTFASDAFPMIPDLTPEGEEPEDEVDEVNPGIFGLNLARFVAEGLRAKGIAASDPEVDDYAWIVDIHGWGHSAYLACNSGWDGAGRFRIMFYPNKPKVWRWFSRIDARPCNQRLTEAVESLLLESGLVRDLVWDQV
jgi:hypothetical protein